ncbi:MAG: hypothetical protein Q4D38_07435 [Planctomycetia bacterium]|nr:hypothetical protein [Planctomycetia bacterium]
MKKCSATLLVASCLMILAASCQTAVGQLVSIGNNRISSTKAVEACGIALVERLNSNSGEVLMGFYDTNRVIKKIREKFNALLVAESIRDKMSEDELKTFFAMFEKELPSIHAQMEEQFDQMFSGMAFHFSGVKRMDGEQWAVVRCEQNDGSVLYWMFRCERTVSGKVEAVEFFNPVLGTSLEDASVDLAVQSAGSVFLAEFGSKERSTKMRMRTLMAEALINGRFGQVIRIYERYFAEDPIVPSIAMTYCQALVSSLSSNVEVDGEADAEVMAKIRDITQRIQKECPNFVGVNLFLIDYYFLKEDFEQTRQVIQKSREVLGEDAHLDFLDAITYITEGNLERGADLLKKAREKNLSSILFYSVYLAQLQENPDLFDEEYDDVYEDAVAEHGGVF